MGVLCLYRHCVFSDALYKNEQPRNGTQYDPYWEWNHPYLEVEDVRPVDEQGDEEVWGIPEA